MKKTLIALLLVLALVLSCVAVLAGCGGKDDPGKDDPKDNPGKDDPGEEKGVTEEDLKLDEDIKVREDSVINIITDPEDERAAGDDELYVR